MLGAEFFVHKGCGVCLHLVLGVYKGARVIQQQPNHSSVPGSSIASCFHQCSTSILCLNKVKGRGSFLLSSAAQVCTHCHDLQGHAKHENTQCQWQNFEFRVSGLGLEQAFPPTHLVGDIDTDVWGTKQHFYHASEAPECRFHERCQSVLFNSLQQWRKGLVWQK